MNFGQFAFYWAACFVGFKILNAGFWIAVGALAKREERAMKEKAPYEPSGL